MNANTNTLEAFATPRAIDAVAYAGNAAQAMADALDYAPHTVDLDEAEQVLTRSRATVAAYDTASVWGDEMLHHEIQCAWTSVHSLADRISEYI